MGHFDKNVFTFLNDLKKNNDREWFQANKHRYERDLKEPFLDFIADADGPLASISMHIVADPKPVGGSLFRIYRDVRFSKDKSPYKTAAGAHFQVGGKGVHGPGYYLHIEPRASFVGGGIWMPDGPTLQKIRERIVAKPTEWAPVAPLVGDDENRLKRPPRGFDPDHPFIEDIKRKSFTAGDPLTQKEVLSDDFMDIFITKCRQIAPLMKFLANAAGVKW